MLPDQRQEEIINGIHIYRINAGKEDRSKKIRIWREIWKLRAVIASADVVHCHDVFFWYLPFRLFYPTKSVFTTFHGYESYPVRKSAIVVRKLSEKLSSGNICIGDFIPKWYGTHPTIVSYGAVEFKSHQVTSSSRYKKNESAVFIGRLDEQTGVMTYAKAVEILQKNYPKFQFDIIGDGKERNLVEKKFTVLGFQKDPEQYLAAYHFAFVSRYLAILESLTAKRLIFAVYDNPIKEDYLKMAPFAGFIVIERDPEKLAEKIMYYLHHPKEEEAMIEKGYAWVKQQTWEKMVEIYLTLWSKKNL